MKVITAFGDSILKGVINIDGHYSLSKSSFAHLCEDELGVQVVNKAMMGSTITKGQRVFDRSINTIAESSSDKVILEFGGNDCDYDWSLVSENPDVAIEPKTSLENFKNSYINLINRIRENDKEPIILSLPPIDSNKYFKWITRNLNAENILKFLGGKEKFLEDWHEAYNLEVFKIGYQNGVKIIDISSCFLKTRSYSDLLCIDGIHPDENGHKLIAGEICSCFA